MRTWVTDDYQVQTDERTVWLHSFKGYTVARFGLQGIDVHTADSTGCIECTHGQTGPHEWLRFVVAVQAHYGVDMRPYVPDRITNAMLGFR